MGGLVDFVTGQGGKDAAAAAREAAGLTAGAQREALDYLRERERLPQQFREGALTQLAGFYGLPGGEGDQQDIIDLARGSPLYQTLMSEGEESVLRHAGATGGLRSGSASENLARLSNRALLSSYQDVMGGLQGFANLPSMAPQIASAMVAPAQTTAQGIIGGAQAEQAANQAFMNNLFGLGGAALMGFSDIRLKTNIHTKGTKNGFNWYGWTWNDLAKDLFNLEGEDEGVMAHEVYDAHPEAIGVYDGFIMVNYDTLGIS